MAPIEFYRYTDGRGDDIVYHFDPTIAQSALTTRAQTTLQSTSQTPPHHQNATQRNHANNPAKASSNFDISSAISVYQNWMHVNPTRTHYSSILLSKEEARRRYLVDRKPEVGMVMCREKRDGAGGGVEVWIWKGYGMGVGGEGWVRVWARG